MTLKAFVRSFLRESGMEAVPPKRASSGKIHLEVWRTPHKWRPLGLEMGHDTIVNFWLVSLNVPKDLPEGVKVTRKTPKGREWTDEKGEGANSNLSAYDEFRTKPISRLAANSVDDAHYLLEALLK